VLKPCKNDSTWATRYDFDNDGISDCVFNTYTGGAHCCYRISIWYSTIDSVIAFPFDIEGGYIFGLDLSNPDQFSIGDFDHDGIPEVQLHIVYNGAGEGVLPAEWRNRYGISQPVVRIEFTGDSISVRDVKSK